MKIKVKTAEHKKEEVTIKTEFIRLDALLKFKGIALTGGQAKILISENKVKVNGEVCNARGKKLRNGDTVCVFSTDYYIKYEN